MLWVLSVLILLLFGTGIYIIAKKGWVAPILEYAGFVGVALLLIGAITTIVVGLVYFIHTGLVRLTSQSTQPTSITREIGP